MSEPYIPPKTLEKLAHPAPKGERHKQAIEVAVSMIGNGIPAPAVIATIRGNVSEDFSDKEIADIVHWAEAKNPKPSTPGSGRAPYTPRTQAPAKPDRTPTDQVEWWTSGAREQPELVAKRSPTPIPEDPREQFLLAVSALYSDADNVNIVCNYTMNGEKANPKGGGKILPRDGWLSYAQDGGKLESQAGAWFRMNPVSAVGSGEAGAVTDQDVTDFRFTLLESDHLPVAVQLALFCRLKLPIAAMVMSGGASAHAWVKVGATAADDYREKVTRILAALKPFGIDQANKNPSRLSRCPGAVRTIGAVGDGVQRLLWLSPTVGTVTDAALAEFEESLQLPAIEDRPLRAIVERAVDRYEYLYDNQGKLGVPTGIDRLDHISGGMKPGHTWVVAGATGGGKSTLALHMVDAALRGGYGVLLYSLEMDKEEVFDLFLSNRASVNRNKFNTGAFKLPEDLDFIKAAMRDVRDLPLYIEDSPVTGADDIRKRTLQLLAAGKIGLVVVDYAQFVNPEWTKDNREQQVATISHKLRALARETKLPMLVLSQLNDEKKLRESRVLAHNANVVLMVDVEGDTMTVSVEKGRGIPYGEYKLDFVRAFGRLIPEKVTSPTADDEVRMKSQRRQHPND